MARPRNVSDFFGSGERKNAFRWCNVFFFSFSNDLRRFAAKCILCNSLNIVCCWFLFILYSCNVSKIDSRLSFRRVFCHVSESSIFAGCRSGFSRSTAESRLAVDILIAIKRTRNKTSRELDVQVQVCRKSIDRANCTEVVFCIIGNWLKKQFSAASESINCGQRKNCCLYLIHDYYCYQRLVFNNSIADNRRTHADSHESRFPLIVKRLARLDSRLHRRDSQ